MSATPGTHGTAGGGRRSATLVAIIATFVALGLPTAAPAAALPHDGAARVPAPPAPVGSLAPLGPLDPAVVTQLEAALDTGFADSGMPGVAVGLWIPGRGEWVATRGVSDRSGPVAMDRANQGKIGSITKTLVGTVALQVIGEGQHGLSLDDTIDRWYPDFPAAAQITVRMLLNMSSGIASPGQAQIDRICADPYSTITPDEVIAIGAALPREPYAPGGGYTYSGFNTFLVGRILEKTTGTDLGTLIDQRLLQPLGMSRSRFAPDGVLAAPLNRGYSGFCPQRPQPTDTTDWANHESWAAGAMLSTLDDLHRWGLGLGAGFGLTPELRAARLADASATGTAGSTYGLGVAVQRDVATGCVLTLSHGGAEPGYGADIVSFTTTGAVFALMGNGDGGTGEQWLRVVAALAPVLLPLASAPPTTSCAPPPTTTTTTSTTAASAPSAPAPATPVASAPAFTG